MKPAKPSLAEAMGDDMPDVEALTADDEESDETAGGQALLDAIDQKDPAAILAAVNAMIDLKMAGSEA